MNNLQWVLEPATRPFDEEGQMHERLFGKRPDTFVAIHEDAMEDTELSASSGRPRYRNVTMISIRNKGEKDFVSVPLKDEHLRMFPRAAKWWQQHKDASAKISVRLLPGMSIAEAMELEGINMGDLDSLLAGELPPELAHWRPIAARIRKPRMRLVDGQLQEVA